MNTKTLPILTLFTSIQLSFGGTVSENIKLLTLADMEAAKEAVKQLNIIGADKANPEHAAAAILGAEVRKVFTAEFNLNKASDNLETVDDKAYDLELQGLEQLKPNVFGQIDMGAARNKFKLAKESRAAAIKQVKDASTATTTALSSLRKESLVLKLPEADMGVLNDLVPTITKRSIEQAKIASDEVEERVKSAFTNLEIANADREKLIEQQKIDREKTRAVKARERAERARERANRRYIPFYPVVPRR